MVGISRTKIIILISLSIISFLLLIRFYHPLNHLFGREFSISFNEVQFWVKRVPERNYYRVCLKYKRNQEGLIQDIGHAVFFTDSVGAGGWDKIFLTLDNSKIYGRGGVYVNYDDKGNPIDRHIGEARSWEEEKKILSLPEEYRLYYLGEGEIDSGIFKPIFPKGTKFTFHPNGALEFTSAPRDYITIYFPGILKKLEKEELEKPSLSEIVENEFPQR